MFFIEVSDAIFDQECFALGRVLRANALRVKSKGDFKMAASQDDSAKQRYVFICGKGDAEQATRLSQLQGYKATLIACDPNASATVGSVIVLMERET
jgi:hypothetical protein